MTGAPGIPRHPAAPAGPAGRSPGRRLAGNREARLSSAMTADEGGRAALSQAYRAIRQGILSGLYRPHDHLREIPLSAELGYSRTPIRTALKDLARDGYVVIVPNRGAFVAAWDAATLADIAEVRAHLSVLAGRLAARHAAADDVQRLRATVAGLHRAIEAGGGRDIETCATLLLGFHGEIFRIGRSRLLARLFEQTTYVPVVQRTFTDFSEADWARTVSYTAQAVDALGVGDGDCLGALMQAYFLMAKRAIIAAGVAYSGSAPTEAGR